MLHHVEIYVANIEKSRLFWSELLEELSYELYQTWNEGFSYKFGETYLVFVQAEEPFLAEGYHRKRIGLNHLAFHGGTKERVDDFRAKLKQKESSFYTKTGFLLLVVKIIMLCFLKIRTV